MTPAAGLKAVVEKNEVVPTRRARDFLQQPKEVNDTYKFHAETYVPVHVGAVGDTQTGVEGFARRFIKQIKARRSPRGYVTAEYGYGKTSTGLYIWEKATGEGLIALPPFQLNKLADYLDATYGWVQYQLGLVSPTHQAQADQIYRRYTQRSLEETAQHYDTDIETIQQMIIDRRLSLDLNTDDMLAFFREMTDLVIDAGFAGLLVIADEIQQYLDPQVRTGVADPIGPLFDIVQGLTDERQNLAFGFLLIMPTMQLGLINDQRGDLIDRMRDFALDLKTVYDREFPSRLWRKLSEIFDFASIADQVIQPETLLSLGQIASRNDLSNGPRTVVNVIKLAANRYLQANDNFHPYTPIDLINSFMIDEVAFDGTKKIQEAVGRALDYDFIRERDDLINAVKLAAAYPQEGVHEAMQAQCGLQEAFEELKASGFGDVVIEVGDRRFPGITLRGLDDVPVETDELALIMRDFGRNYIVQADLTKARAVKGFVALLQTGIFRDRDWKVVASNDPDMFRGWELVFEGAFSQMVRDFPQRNIHVCITFDDAPDNQHQLEGEVHLFFDLRRYLEIEPDQRKNITGEVDVNRENFSATLSLNLMLPANEHANYQLRDQLLKSVNSSQITPLLLLALHTYLSELLERGRTSKRIAQLIESSIHRQIVQTIVQVLFNPALGNDFDANGTQIVEYIVGDLIQERYGDQYHTLITYQRWRDVLRSYISWLKKLPSTSQKRGLTPLTGGKNDIARHFDEAVTSLDNKLGRIPDLIDIKGGSLSTRADNEIYFKLHPLEQQILAALQGSSETVLYQDQKLHLVLEIDLYRWSSAIGYTREEIEYILQILEARELILSKDGQIIQAPRIDLSLDEIKKQVNEFQVRAQHLAQAFPKPDAEHYLQLAKQYRQNVTSLSQGNEDDLLRLYEALSASQNALTSSLATHVSHTKQQLRKAEENLPKLQDEDVQMLNEPIRGSGYTHTLNTIRLALLDRYDWFSEQVARLKDQVIETDTASVLQDTVSLYRYVQGIQSIANDVEKLANEWQQYQRPMHLIVRWRQFTDDEVQVRDTISRMGEPGTEFLIELDDLDQDIQTMLDQNGEQALSTITEFARRLKSISDAISKRRSSANVKFDREETAYRRALIRDGGLSESDLWDKLPFNPEKPGQFYAHLHNQVRQSAAKILDDVSEQIQRHRDNLTMLTNNQRLIDTGQIYAVSDLQASLDKLTDTLSRPYALNTEDGVRDYDGNFTRMMSVISEIRHEVLSIGEEFTRLKTLAQPPLRSHEADIIYQAMEQCRKGLNQPVDLVQLREAVRSTSPSMKDELFWTALRELWEQQWIRFMIS